MTTVESDSAAHSASVREVTSCLGCGARGLAPVLDLGNQPLANNLVPPGTTAEDPVFPLGIQVCQACGLVQLTHLVDPGLMFSSYLYVPSTSSTWVQHCEDIAADVSARSDLKPGEFVVEIGSNDGTLLRPF